MARVNIQAFHPFALTDHRPLYIPCDAIGVDKSVPWPPCFVRGFTGRSFSRPQAFEIPAKFRLIKRRPLAFVVREPERT